MPDADNAAGGGFYTNSSVSGRRADFVVEELVSRVERRYRSMVDRSHRALAGHSMGGFGALALGFRYPERFGLIYPMNPSCVSFVGELAPTGAGWAEVAGERSWHVPQAAFRTRRIIAGAPAPSPDPGAPRE